MIVLKKFGLSFLLVLLVVMTTCAQTAKTSKPKSKTKQQTTAKADISKKQASKPSVSKKTTVKKQTVTPNQSTSKPSLTKVDTKKTIPANCDNDKCVTVVTVSDRKKTPNAWSVNNDLLLARTSTKPAATTTKKVAEVEKAEETSFSTTVMDWVKDKYATMIEVLPNQISNVMLYRFIDDWYGVKYRMGGTSKKGVDCSAFVQSLYKYVFDMDLVRTAGMQFNSSQIIKDPSELKEGDLVFFKVNSSRISHVGVYLRNNFFVHSASSKGVSIASLTSGYWSKYFAGGGRVVNN